MSLPKIQGEVGKLWDDVTLRWTPGGKAVASLPLVFEKRKKNQQGEWEKDSELWVRGTAWERLGENVAESLSKGDEVVVSGELSMREYERTDGSKGQSLELRIDAIGPSLRWNPAKPARPERSTDKAPAGDDPWGTAAPTGSGFDSTPPF